MSKKNASTAKAVRNGSQGKAPPKSEQAPAQVPASTATPVTINDPLADLKHAYAQGNDALALELCSKHLAESPNDLNVLKIAARIHNRQQNWQAAWETWSQLMQLEPSNPEPPLQLARIAVRQKKVSEALSLFDKVLTLSPTHEEALLTRLTLFTSQDDMASALASARRLAQVGVRGKADALVKLARTLFDKHHRLGDALEVATLATAQDTTHPEAVKLCAKILATLQTDAIAAHLEGDVDGAAQACREILRSLPMHERANAILREIVRPLLLEARALYKSGQSEAAVDAYHSVLAVNPNHDEGLRSLARLHAKAGEEATAADFWARLEHISPEDPEPQLQLARLRAKAGDNEAALVRYHKLALSHGPYVDEATSNRDRMAARVLRDAGIKARDLELDEALRLTELVAQLERPPENLADVRARVEVLSAREAAHAFKAQDNAGAVAHAKRALAVNPANEKALMVLARAGHKAQDYRAALGAWRKIAELQPDNSEAWLQQGRYYLRFREYDAATVAATRLQELVPGHDEATSIIETAASKIAATHQ